MILRFLQLLVLVAILCACMLRVAPEIRTEAGVLLRREAAVGLRRIADRLEQETGR